MNKKQKEPIKMKNKDFKYLIFFIVFLLEVNITT